MPPTLQQRNQLRQRQEAARKKVKPKTTQSNAPDDEEDIPEQEKDAVSKILAQIDRAKRLREDFIGKSPKGGTDSGELARLRRLVWGAEKPNKEETTVRTNMIYATEATLLPHIYAKNPEIAVSPHEAVNPQEYAGLKDFCKTAQILINRLLVGEAKLKRRIKSNIRSTMATSVGWLKLSYQHNLTADDPIILRRANDMQDNLQAIEGLIKRLDNEDDRKTQNELKEQLENQLQSMIKKGEVKWFKGFTLDRLQTEDMFILDESIVEFDDYVHAKRLAHRVFMDDEEFCARYKRDKVPKGATSYARPSATSEQPDNAQSASEGKEVNYRAVYEVWDHTSNTVCEVAEGCKGYVRKPRVMECSPERWLPFYCLGYNLVEGRWRPISDTELLQKLQEEYNTTRYLYAEARKQAIPTLIFRKGGNLTEADIIHITRRKPGDNIGVEGNPSQPLAQDIFEFKGVTIQPEAYDVTIIRNDMDMMVGLSDASRANLVEAKTATEAEIMRQALMSRVAERQDTTEDLISEMAQAVLQIALKSFSLKEVKELVGEGARWTESLPVINPETNEPDPEAIYRMVRVQVKAGTTGKPNVQKERENWTQLMPVINETIQQVAELRMAGQGDLAESKIELLKETLTRFDEKIDVERFIKPEQLDAEGNPVQKPNNGAQQAAAMAEQLEACKQELAKCQEALTQCQMDLKIAKQAQDARIAEAEANKAIDVARETSKHEQSMRQLEIKAAQEFRLQQQKLTNDLIAERMRIASTERVAAITAGQAEYAEKLRLESAEFIQALEIKAENERHDKELENAIEQAKINAKAKSKAKTEG